MRPCCALIGDTASDMLAGASAGAYVRAIPPRPTPIFDVGSEMIRRTLLSANSHKQVDSTPITHLTERDELDRAMQASLVVLYKHSPRCAMSWWAHREVQRFAGAHPDADVYLIDVVRNGDLSDSMTQRFGVPHESPQALVVRNGQAAWAGSHGNVTAAALETYLPVPPPRL